TRSASPCATRTRSVRSRSSAAASSPGSSADPVKIAVLPGDGVGPEVVAEAVKVLSALGGPKLEMEPAPVGGAAYDASGDPLPAATLALAKKADAVLFG